MAGSGSTVRCPQFRVFFGGESLVEHDNDVITASVCYAITLNDNLR